MTDRPGDPADKAADGAFGGKPTASHRSGYGRTLARVEGWLREFPNCTLASGEGRALLEEIDRLREQLRLAHADAINEATENAELRSELAEARGVIARVAAHHHCGSKGLSGTCVACGHNYPCATIRAIAAARGDA